MADPILALQLRTRLRFGAKIRLRRPKAWIFPHNAEREMQAKILQTVDVIHEITKKLVYPQLQRLAADAAYIRGDSWSDDLDMLGQQLRLRVDLESPNEIQTAAAAASSVSEFNMKEWRSVVRKSIGIDLFTSEPWLRDELKSWSRDTASLITTLEDDSVKQVGLWTSKGIREGWRWEDIAKNIEDRFDVSRSRARFIARDQTGKLNGQLTQRRQTQASVTHYFWQDSRDERVRGNPGGLYPKAIPSHWDRNGRRFAWDEPPAGGHPGQDYNCRCTAQPDLTGMLSGLSDGSGSGVQSNDEEGDT